MKRTPLARKTRLAYGTKPLQRSELARGSCSLLRSQGINPVSRKRSQANAQRRVVVDGMRAASDGRCPRCATTGLVLHGHELRARSQGGSIIDPQVLICDPCNSAIEDQPRVSCWNGWKLSPKWPHDPALAIGEARDLFGNVVVFAGSSVPSGMETSA